MACDGLALAAGLFMPLGFAPFEAYPVVALSLALLLLAGFAASTCPRAAL